MICIGGFDKWNALAKMLFRNPLGPTIAVKPAATTTVGSMKGRLVITCNALLPGKEYLAKRKAVGNPIRNVKNVERPACQKVKLTRFRINDQGIERIPDDGIRSKLVLKMVTSG